MRTPLVIVTGVAPVAMDTTLMGLSWDLPRAVAVRHRIDPESQVLTRTVSDATGVLEQEQITLEHACVTCALREDIVPTLERLARDGRWQSVVSGLPTATEANQLAHIATRDSRVARYLRLSTVVTALDTSDVVRDLLSDDLLRERGLHSNPYDDRGVGEVACAQIEFADVVVLDGAASPEGHDLVHALARPDALVVSGVDQLGGSVVVEHRHVHSHTTAWSSPELGIDLAPLGDSRAWRLALSSERPFHPERLVEQIERLGTGAHRSRGSFWLPTRPGDVLEWSGAGGQLSIGSFGSWESRSPATRLLVTGVGNPPDELVTAFEDLLLTPVEARREQHTWVVLEDGLEPWLGDIRDVA